MPLRQDNASTLLPRPIRRVVQGAPGTVTYAGYAVHEAILPYGGKRELLPASTLAGLAQELVGIPVVLMRPTPAGRTHSEGLVTADRPATTAGTILAAEVVDAQELGGVKAIRVDFACHLAEAQAILDRGAGLSVSSQAEVIDQPGTWRGDAYDAVQVRRYSPDHVLITDIPRAPGALVRADADGADMPLTPEDYTGIADAVVKAMMAAGYKPPEAPPAAPAEPPAKDAMAELQQRADSLEAELLTHDLALLTPALKAAGLDHKPKTRAEVKAAWEAIGRASVATRADAATPRTGPLSPPLPAPRAADPASSTSNAAPVRRI